MNTVLACVKLQNVEMALMNKRALSYGNDCTASFCNTLCTHQCSTRPHSPHATVLTTEGGGSQGQRKV